MKEICKNCIHAAPTYKGRYCVANTKKKMVKLSDSCEKWKERQK